MLIHDKRYHTWNYYLRKTYGKKVYKIALDAGFSCPNRDGQCGYGGCRFCGEKGSGDFTEIKQDSLLQQFAKGFLRIQEKDPNALAIAYFQAFSNTYAPLEQLKKLYEPFVQHRDVTILSIATRADCLEKDCITYLDQLCDKKEVWLEIGLQSIHDESTRSMNRGHDYQSFLACMKRLSKTRLKICVHIINSLPNENAKMMIDSAKALAQLPIHAVKIHMLHVTSDSALGKSYLQEPFPLLDCEQYIDVVIAQLEVLPPTFIIQRVTGDGNMATLLAPTWTRNKLAVLNGIDKEMKKRNTWQGKYYNKKVPF